MQDRNLQVLVDKWASPEEVRAVEEAFRRVGLEANVRAGVVELSQQLTWIVIVSIPPSAFLTAYFGAAGADAWKATKGLSNWVRRFVQDLKDARGGDQEGTIELEDAGRAWLLLPSDLPEEAFRQLETVDWSTAQNGSLKWDDQGKSTPAHGGTEMKISRNFLLVL
jgi:hypothetical protein